MQLAGGEAATAMAMVKPTSGEDPSCSNNDPRSSDWKALERCIAASVKGFVIGAGLRGGLALFTGLLRMKRKGLSRSPNGKLILVTNKEVMKTVVEETMRYGLFLGTFAGVFTTVDEGIAAINGFKRIFKWRALIAGAIAGPALLLTGPKTRHTSMAIYILMRAAVLAARCGIKSKRLGWFFRPLSWKHGDTFLMCLSSSQILSAWLLRPDSLPSSYISFLNKHGGKDMSIVKGIRRLALKQDLGPSITRIKDHYRASGVDVQLDPCMKIPCTIIHGNESCVQHFATFLFNAYKRAVPVYVPVYLVPALIVHRQGLFRRPFPILIKTLIGTARSSLFLASYCASAWLWSCAIFRAVGSCNTALLAAGTFPSGLALMIEKKSRRMEIALYCFSRATESFFLCIGHGKQEKFRLIDRVDIVLFSFATAIIMHCYSQERDVFRSKYLNVLDWVFGVPHANIQHDAKEKSSASDGRHDALDEC